MGSRNFMPNEKELFQTTGRPWSELASFGELDAVLTASGKGDETPRNVFLHNEQLFAAKKICSFLPYPAHVVDFGCGTGRFVRYFGQRGHSVLGTEITAEMLKQADKFGVPVGSNLVLTDGIRIPVANCTIDLVYVFSVLRYSLNVSNPVYDQIAREMYRVLRPQGRVVNVEMYVEQPISDFTSDFEAAGFETESARVIGRHSGKFEQILQSGRFPIWLVQLGARLTAFCRYHLDSVKSEKTGLRDYFFVWKKL